MFEAIVGNGQGYSTEKAALGFPAGGLGPDNRFGIYIGDSWKILPNLTISPGLRYVRDTGRTDSDLPAIPELNAAFPGLGNRVRNPNKNFAPQLGIAWDPGKNGKTVVRAGIGLFYENVIYNNVLFDRPQRLREGAFLYYAASCFAGQNLPVLLPNGSPIAFPTNTCGDDSTGNMLPIWEVAPQVAALESNLKASYPFDPTAQNGNFIGNYLNGNAAEGANMFAPNYISPRSIQMNFGIQREIRHGMVFTADFLRNVETHGLLGEDVNKVGTANNFSAAGAEDAVEGAANATSGCGGMTGAAAVNCVITASPSAAAGVFLANGIGTPADANGVACPVDPSIAHPCAFGGINQNQNAFAMLFPISRSVYNALQMKLVQNVANPFRGVKTANFQVAYSLSLHQSAGFPGQQPALEPSQRQRPGLRAPGGGQQQPAAIHGAVAAGSHAPVLIRWKLRCSLRLPPWGHRPLLQSAVEPRDCGQHTERWTDLPDGLHRRRRSQRAPSGHDQRLVRARLQRRRPERGHQQIQHQRSEPGYAGRTAVDLGWAV